MTRNAFTEKGSFEDLRKQHAELLERHGWVAHYVMDDAAYPNRTNYHTHGLPENYNHQDLEICLPVRQEHAHAIFSAVVGRIKEGFVFKAGQTYNNILAGGVSVTFKEVNSDGILRLRILLPDENGRYEAPFYKEQLDSVPPLIRKAT
jgi:Domain of unknown function (DUF4262)